LAGLPMHKQFLAGGSCEACLSNLCQHFFIKSTMEKETGTKTPAGDKTIGATAVASLVTPNTVIKEWQYEDIVEDIISKNKKRVFCTACTEYNKKTGQPKIEDSPATYDDCVFYKHEEVMIYAAEHEMNFPKQMYKNKKEQGARLACYKLWTKLEVGAVGRRPLPVCVEARIKLLNPSTIFTGYKRNYDENDSDSSAEEDMSVGTVFTQP